MYPINAFKILKFDKEEKNYFPIRIICNTELLHLMDIDRKLYDAMARMFFGRSLFRRLGVITRQYYRLLNRHRKGFILENKKMAAEKSLGPECGGTLSKEELLRISATIRDGVSPEKEGEYRRSTCAFIDNVSAKLKLYHFLILGVFNVF